MEIERELARINETLSTLREEIGALRQVFLTSLTAEQKRKVQEVLAGRPPASARRRSAVTANSLPPSATATSHESFDSGGS